MLLCIIADGQIFAQGECLSAEEAQKAVSLLDSPQIISLNKSLRQELIDLKAEQLRAEQKIIDGEAKQNLIADFKESGKKNLLRLCEIVKQNGWTDKKLVGEDGFAAAMFIISNGSDTKLQREIFPVLAAAVKKGLIGNSEIAPLIDSIRIGEGQPQIFGTQSRIRNDVLYLYPLVSDAKVDEYRKAYGLLPLSTYIKYLQFQYGMPVIKSPRSFTAPQLKQNKENSPAVNSTDPQALNLEQEEVVKVESNVVSLNARVSSKDSTNADLNLQKSDFALFQDGRQQEISFFSTTDAPFDLVLVLDLSGSTSGKRDLIRQSTKRFIEAARATDRIAILTFTDQVKIISQLTQDKAQLLESAKKIGDSGGSAVWLGLQSALDEIIKPESTGRRSAVVLMTDGVDSSLLTPYILSDSYPNFSDLLETVRDGNTTIIPIYLDTESSSSPHRVYRAARQTLSMLAEESGGEIYYAKKIENLNGVYEQVISDLGKVYSLGYEPSEITRDGAWHTLEIKIPTHPDLTVRAKTGFYAK